MQRALALPKCIAKNKRKKQKIINQTQLKDNKNISYNVDENQKLSTLICMHKRGHHEMSGMSK